MLIVSCCFGSGSIPIALLIERLEIEQIILELVQTKNLTAARQFLGKLRDVLESIATEAAKDLPQFEWKLAQQQANVNNFKTQTIPNLQQLLHQQRSWLDNLVNGKNTV